MAVNLSPIGNDAPFLDSSGNPLSGGLLYTYTAGSSSPQNTFTTLAGTVANANPVVLDSGGYPASGGSIVSIWLTSGVKYKFVLKTSGGVTIWTRDNVSGINDTAVSAGDEWAVGPAPTFVGATQFTLVGDQTTEFHVGRRVKATVTAGTSYGTITVSAFTSLTTVTVDTTGSNPLDSGLSAVSVGVMRAVNTSWPQIATAGTNISIAWTNGKPTITNTLTPVGLLLNTINYTAQTQNLTSISNATPAVFTCTSAAHLPETGSPIQLTTSGGLPAGLSTSTTYFVTNPASTTFNVCATYADALAGTNKINTSSAGSGTHAMNSIYVRNASATFIVAEVWGAGGGSGGAGAGGTTGGVGGAGAGGYSRKKVLTSALAATETITIGAGGTAGTNAGSAGGTGGTTSFGAHCSATGGSGSSGISGSGWTVGVGGGAGSGGDINLTGAVGANPPPPVANSFGSGAGGASILGGNGVGYVSAGGVGTTALNNSGSGAGGASPGTVAGGVGGSGRVIVYEYS